MSDLVRDLGLFAIGALMFAAVVAGLQLLFGGDRPEQHEAGELEVGDQIVPSCEPAWNAWQRVPVIDVRSSNIDACRELVALGTWRLRVPGESDEDVAARVRSSAP